LFDSAIEAREVVPRRINENELIKWADHGTNLLECGPLVPLAWVVHVQLDLGGVADLLRKRYLGSRLDAFALGIQLLIY
jgi:hypothetical protein